MAANFVGYRHQVQCAHSHRQSARGWREDLDPCRNAELAVAVGRDAELRASAPAEDGGGTFVYWARAFDFWECGADRDEQIPRAWRDVGVGGQNRAGAIEVAIAGEIGQLKRQQPSQQTRGQPSELERDARQSLANRSEHDAGAA